MKDNSVNTIKVFDMNMMDKLLYFLHIMKVAEFDDIIDFWWYFNQEIYSYLENIKYFDIIYGNKNDGLERYMIVLENIFTIYL